MNKKLLSIVVIIIIVGAIAGYLFVFKNGGSPLFSSSTSSQSSEKSLIGLWKLEKQIYWYTATNELKEMPIEGQELANKYFEFKNNGQACIGAVDYKGQPLSCAI